MRGREGEGGQVRGREGEGGQVRGREGGGEQEDRGKKEGGR